MKFFYPVFSQLLFLYNSSRSTRGSQFDLAINTNKIANMSMQLLGAGIVWLVSSIPTSATNNPLSQTSRVNLPTKKNSSMISYPAQKRVHKQLMQYIAKVAQQPKAVRINSFSRPELDFAPPINIQQYLASQYHKPNVWQKLNNYYHSLFDSNLKFDPYQVTQLPPLKYTNKDTNIYSLEPNYNNYLKDDLTKSNNYFQVENGGFENRVYGLGSIKQIARQPNNIYAQAAKNVIDALKTIEPINADGSLRHQFNVEELITRALQAYGFFSPQISVVRTAKNLFIIHLKIGKPTRVLPRSTLIVRGEGTGFGGYQDLAKLLTPANQVFSTAQYDQAKQTLTDTATSYGFFDGKFLQHQVLVNKEQHQAFWEIDYDTGPRYTIDKINFTGSKIDPKMLSYAVAVFSGDLYSENNVSLGITRLRGSKWFDAIAVDPIINTKKKTVNLEYKVLAAKPNSLDWSLGFDSLEGARTQLQYDRRYVNRYGGSIQTNLYMSRFKQNLDFNYKHPYFYNPIEKFFNVGVNFDRSYHPNIDDYSKSFVGYLNYTRVPANNWQLAMTLNIRRDLWHYNNKSYNVDLSYLDVNFARTSLTTEVNLNLKSNFVLGQVFRSSVNFNTASLKLSHTFQINKLNQLKLSLQYAKIFTNNFYKITPTLRLYSGGANSIRGYSYNSVSEYHGHYGIGGTAQDEFSVEYLHTLVTNLKGVLFVDAGQTSDRIRYNNLKYGAGMGIRYELPVGYASFDIAYPIQDKFNWKRISLYLSITTQI